MTGLEELLGGEKFQGTLEQTTAILLEKCQQARVADAYVLSEFALREIIEVAHAMGAYSGGNQVHALWRSGLKGVLP